MIKIAVSGACGRMAGQVLRRACEQDDMEIVAAIDVTENGKDIGEVLGIGSLGVKVENPDGLESVLKEKKPDILVDFTNPESSMRNAKIAGEIGTGVVIGTTGVTDAQLKEIKQSVGKAVIAPNFSVCVNLFFKMAAEAAKILKDYDIEIIEAHHRFKKDSPSGTALKLAEKVANASERDVKDMVCGREGRVGERKLDEIGVHAVRAGDIVGDHTLLFGTLGERLEIKHQAHSRDAFAYGCLKAIRWLHGRKSGVYGMEDVLGL